MASGSTQGPIAVAVVPTGRLGDPANRFFQTFTSTGGDWLLTTPRGTATNGGIVVASPAAGAAAVLPFAASHVSSLVALNAGRPARDGIVIPALVAGPTSVTVNPSTGRMTLVTRTGVIEEAVSVSGGLHAVASTRSAAGSRAGRRCGVVAFSSAATMVDGTLVLGGRCAGSGGSGLLLEHDGRWISISAPTPGPWSVVRVDPTDDGVVALVASSGRQTELRMLALTATHRTWSAPMILKGSLRSTAITRAAARRPSYVVALADRGQVQAWRIHGERVARRVGPTLAGDVQAVVDDPGGSPTAFAVDGRTVVPLGLDGRSGRWVRGRSQVLPLAYGTSG